MLAVMPGPTTTYCRICEAACGLTVERDPRGAPVALRPDRARAADPRAEGLDRLLDLAERVTPERAERVTGIPAQAITDLAERLCAARSASLHMSVGVNQGPFGTLAYVALQALAFVTGNLDREGGSLFHPLAVATARAFRALGVGTETWHSRLDGFPSVLDQLPGGVLADEA